MEVAFTPQFRRQFKKLSAPLQEEALEKIELFKNSAEHKALRVHKLNGPLKNSYSFSVNYRYRIVFIWETPQQSALLMGIGDHALYA